MISPTHCFACGAVLGESGVMKHRGDCILRELVERTFDSIRSQLLPGAGEDLIPKYILKPDHTVERCRDIIAWGIWMESAPNRVLRQEHVDAYFVSTIFLGIPFAIPILRNDAPPERPVLFETMVFAGGESLRCQRCCTWDEAIQQHESIAAEVRAMLSN